MISDDLPDIESTLLSTYHLPEMLEYDFGRILDLYINAIAQRNEDRLWIVYANIITSPYVGDNVPSWTEFKSNKKKKQKGFA